jgi:PhnB protein
VSDRENSAAVDIVPELSVRRGREAVEFYKRAFGAIEVYRVGGTDDNPDVVAQLSIGGASFWVSDEAPASANFSPESVGGGTVRMLLIVDDPNAAIERAKAAGANEVYAVVEEHGWRLGRIRSATTGRSASRWFRGRLPTAGPAAITDLQPLCQSPQRRSRARSAIEGGGSPLPRPGARTK